MTRLATASDVLGHPFLILLVGTALTGLLVPYFSLKRQRAQKALETKIALVEEITQDVTEFVMAIQFAVLRAAGQTQEQFDEAFKRWSVRHAVIEARVGAYFQGERLVHEWNGLSSDLTDFYALTGIQREEDREAAFERLCRGQGMERHGSYGEDWGRLKDSLLRRQRNFARALLAEETQVISHPEAKTTI